MLRYLSDEWLAAVDDAVHGHAALRAATAGVHLTIGQVVGDGDGHPAVTYVVRLADGDNRVVPGPVDGADVTFTTDRATATAVAVGDESAQTAFLDGRLRLAGDVDRLIEHQGALAGLDDVLASVRARTLFEG